MITVDDANRAHDDEFIRLVESYQLSILQLCFTYLHDKSLAEDAVQETFLKAYRNFGLFRKESSEKTWISHIAINCCRDMNKSGWFRHFDRTVTPDMLPASTQDSLALDNEVLLEVMKLPIRLRETVLLYYFEDMTSVEIADVLHISQQAVSARLKRALARLQKTLGESFEEGEFDA